jgi:CRISPR-associated protein Cmr4
MSKLMIGLYAETFLHPGSGQNEGAIDLPVMREKVTGYPVILGSSLKGALRAKAAADQSEQALDDFFGKQEGAGGILVGDARLLLLPIRSLTGSFKWVTCQHVVNRLQRDSARCDRPISVSVPEVVSGTYASVNNSAASEAQALYLEERRLEPQENHIDEALVQLIASTMPANIDINELRQRLVIVDNDDFAWFCGNSLPIHARNVLNNETKASKNLWYEEALPPETVLYAVFLPRFDASLMGRFQQQVIQNNAYLQVGGNETIGQGWLAMSVMPAPQQEAV